MIELPPAQAAERIAALLAATESRTLEFKRISGKQGRMYEAICAFANTDGGLLVLGIGDSKAIKPGDTGKSRLFGIEENPEGFDNFRAELLTRFTPAITALHWLRVPCTLNTGQAGTVVVLRVEKSQLVHSIVGNGTWTRQDTGNRELTALEIADLAYQRGVKSAETLTLPMSLDLLNTDAWHSYCRTRGLTDADLAVRLPRLGLALPGANGPQPLLAAVLLFADEPGALLAAHAMRADIRVFDDRVEVESPGQLPGRLTTGTIGTAGSVPRNNLLVRHLREFPNPPNVDAGEGVPMMFAQMAQANLYAPLYREQTDSAIPTLLVTLLNEARPPLWVQVSDWIDRNGPLANGSLREISGLDTLTASKQLRQWVTRGVLVALPAASRQQARYTKPDVAGQVNLTGSLSLAQDNEL
jgi:predicted HTH transcriptional regulator